MCVPLIVAPVSGRAHNLSFFTVGGVVPAANSIMQIIPDNDRLIIEARVRLTDTYIRTEERTPLDYFLKPMANQIMRAFKKQ
ncbi:MAG: HlyD family efflux transporter periplasmic adaptor subunit [Alphaproteobacteria bacterium]|nr:HlyD family efflux transporter periplasmic adaptor subunit [Alphaproteobacteria bacterium]